MKAKRNFDIWKCRCGYLMANVAMMTARFDYGCPWCDRSFGTFRLVKTPKRRKK